MSPTANRTQELLNDSTCSYDTESGSVWARFFCALERCNEDVLKPF